MLKQILIRKSTGKTIAKVVQQHEFLVIRFTDDTFSALCPGELCGPEPESEGSQDFLVNLSPDSTGYVKAGWCAPFENAGVYTHEEYTNAVEEGKKVRADWETSNKLREYERLKQEFDR